MASRGCRDKYINKDAVLTHQLQNDQLIKTLDQLKQELYIALGSPFQLQLINDTDDADTSYSIGQYIIWQEDRQAELYGFQSFTIPLSYQIQVYTKVLDKLIPGVIQLQLPIDNIILIDFVKKKRVRIKKNKVVDINVVQLQLGLVG